MRRRKPARPGLSYFDANRDRLVTFSDDVLGIQRQIKERWPGRINCYFDDWEEVWVLTQINGAEETFLFDTKKLDDRVIERLSNADQTNVNHVDLQTALDNWEADYQREEDHKLEDIAGDVGERLIHAFKKDGIADHASIYGTNPKVNRRRVMNR